MKNSSEEYTEVQYLVDSLIEGQKKTLLSVGRRIVPILTPEDILQPNDYPELENHPHFRYEEGVLAGMQTIQMALYAKRKDEMDEMEEVKN